MKYVYTKVVPAAKVDSRDKTTVMSLLEAPSLIEAPMEMLQLVMYFRVPHIAPSRVLCFQYSQLPFVNYEQNFTSEMLQVW